MPRCEKRSTLPLERLCYDLSGSGDRRHGCRPVDRPRADGRHRQEARRQRIVFRRIGIGRDAARAPSCARRPRFIANVQCVAPPWRRSYALRGYWAAPACPSSRDRCDESQHPCHGAALKSAMQRFCAGIVYIL
ncbi:hypothetical protein WR25_17982 [Diploscapter pachys]|uniref:Uncharacterized protein n=1 Tax=Diploscapter pachys TaxID=2018661 RepID=A0A2A2KA95_9BILA|nr:hypothetical protein WR25_17982 [Diploscapter pachys]